MLKPAYLFRELLDKKICDIAFDLKYMFWNFTSYWQYDCKVMDSSWEALQMVSVGKDDKIIGYLSAWISRGDDKISGIGAMNFCETSMAFSQDFGNFLAALFDNFNFRKIEFCVVIGNPIEASYDKIISKYGGRVVGVERESVKLIDNKYYDVKRYEIFKSDYDINKRPRAITLTPGKL